MSLEPARPAPAGAPGALPRAKTAATYNAKLVHQFTVATVFWGIVGMGVGVFVAAQLYWPALNLDIPWLSYGRLRPLHTHGVLFPFGGSVRSATSLSVVQPPCPLRLISHSHAPFRVWGWQGGMH